MPSSRLASKATSSALRAASSGWSRFVREMHHPRTLQMIAYAIVLLVLVVLVGMVCLASRKELFVVRPETDTLQTLSTLHTVEGFVGPVPVGTSGQTPTTPTTLAQTTTTGTPSSTSPNGFTSPQCNKYMAGGLNPAVCNNTVAANRIQKGTPCQYYLFDKPGVYEGTIQVQDAKHITFCEKPGFLTSSSSTSSSDTTSPSTPLTSKKPQEMMKCSITLDTMMQDMEQVMQKKLQSSTDKMNQSVQDMNSTYTKTMAQNQRTMAQNKQTIEDLHSTLNSQQQQIQSLQKDALIAENTAGVAIHNTASQASQTYGSPSPTPSSSRYSSPSAEDDTNDELDGEDDTEGFTVHSPSSSGHSTHNNVGYTPTTAKQPPCNVFQYTPQSKCTSYTFPGSTKTTLVQGGMYVKRPSDIRYRSSTQGNSNLTDTCKSTVQQFKTYADHQTQHLHRQTQTASHNFKTQSDDLKHRANDMNARIKTTQSNVAQIVAAGPS